MFLPLIMLASCAEEERSAAIPSGEDIARLEAALERNPCVGSLDKWERHYRFQTRRMTFNKTAVVANLGVIEFQLRPAGTTVSQPGFVVHAAEPVHPFPPVSREERTLTGLFAIGSGKLNIRGC